MGGKAVCSILIFVVNPKAYFIDIKLILFLVIRYYLSIKLEKNWWNVVSPLKKVYKAGVFFLTSKDDMITNNTIFNENGNDVNSD